VGDGLPISRSGVWHDRGGDQERRDAGLSRETTAAEEVVPKGDDRERRVEGDGSGGRASAITGTTGSSQGGDLINMQRMHNFWPNKRKLNDLPGYN
jgi:hypothetical protein